MHQRLRPVAATNRRFPLPLSMIIVIVSPLNADKGAEAMADGPSGPRTLLEDLSLDLNHVAAMLAFYAGEDARRRAAAAAAAADPRRPAPDRVRALIAARNARSAAFGHELASPGWTLLLTLYQARLEARPLALARLPAAARLTPASALRWLGRLCATGHARRWAGEEGGTQVALTDAGAEAIEDYFAAVAAGLD
jgi:hypothetical protein